MFSQKDDAYVTDKFDLIYVDGAHDEVSVYNDLVNYYPKLATNGVICGDDWCLSPTDKYECDFNDTAVIEHPLEPVAEDSRYSVRRAVKKFAKENNLKVLSVQNLFWFV